MQELKFKPKSKIREFLGEKFLAVNAWVALIGIFLIFVFIFKETIPLFLDPEATQHAGLRKMLFKQVWTEGKAAKWSWQPNSDTPKFSLLPLFLGTIKAAIVAMLFAAPLGVGAAMYSSEFAGKRMREVIKPVIELLAGIPSVVLGFFALIVLASFVQSTFGFDYRLNSVTAGIALGIAIIPIIFTVAEDAMVSVPQSLRDAALAVGANRWQVSFTVVLPAALPGIFASFVLGFGRAIGETMIVLMASGNAAIISMNFNEPIRTFSATIAAELGEVVFGDTHYSVLFFIGVLLFIFTFLVNLTSHVVMERLRERLQGRTK